MVKLLKVQRCLEEFEVEIFGSTARKDLKCGEQDSAILRSNCSTHGVQSSENAQNRNADSYCGADSDIYCPNFRHALTTSDEQELFDDSPARDSQYRPDGWCWPANDRGYQPTPPPPAYLCEGVGRDIELVHFDAKSVSQGGISWKAFYCQVEHTAQTYGWNEWTKLGRLRGALRGPALEFLARLPTEVQSDYQSLVHRLQLRYGRKELPLVQQFELHEVRQDDDEDLDDFADRVMDLAEGAYSEYQMDRTAIEVIAVGALLTGCSDHEAAATVLNQAPNSMQEALRLLRTAITTKKLVSLKWERSKAVHDQSPRALVRCVCEADSDARTLEMQALRKQMADQRRSDEAQLAEIRAQLAEVRAIREEMLALQTSLLSLQMALEGSKQEFDAKKDMRVCSERGERLTIWSPSPNMRIDLHLLNHACRALTSLKVRCPLEVNALL